MIESKLETVQSALEGVDLHAACRTGDLLAIKSAFKQYSDQVNAIDQSLGWTPLFRTVIFGHIKAAKFLLKHGANPNIPNTLGETPLHQAADNSQYIIATLLLSYKANPNIQQTEGDTALHHAAFRNDHKMLKILLKFGADPNLPNFIFKRTPMHLICEYGDKRSVLLMIKYKGNVTLQDSQGNSAENKASPEIKTEILKFFLMGTEDAHSIVQEKHTGLYYWLLDIGLAGYYPKFTSMGYTEQDQILKRIKSGLMMTEEELKEMGILKIGHRFRILVKLEEDAGVFPTHKNWQCCLAPRKTQFGFTLMTLQAWLKCLKLESLQKAFEEAGYEDFSFILTQMKSRHPITDEILTKIGIDKPGYRNRIIGNLTEEVKEKEIIVESSQTKTSCESCIVN